MRWWAVWGLLVVAIALALTVYYWPQVEDLFRTTPRQENPLEFLEDKPQFSPGLGSEPEARNSRPPSAPHPDSPPADASAPPATPEVPSPEVSRILLQILAAKNLTQGISLSVTDEMITVGGQVDSAEKRQQILNILEKGRGTRRIDASGLLVRP